MVINEIFFFCSIGLVHRIDSFHFIAATSSGRGARMKLYVTEQKPGEPFQYGKDLGCANIYVYRAVTNLTRYKSSPAVARRIETPGGRTLW